MGVIKIEGKSITLDDAIINAGIPAIKDALSVDFPDVENADIEIERPIHVGAPATATVVKRGTGKGQGETLPAGQAEVLTALSSAPEYLNPAIALATEAMRAEAMGDTQFLESAIRRGIVERAVAEGEREGRAVQKALAACGHGIPVASKKVPVGF